MFQPLPARSLRLVPLAALLLAGCFKPYGDLPLLDFSEVPFDNGLVTATDAVIRSYESALDCPDGQGARFSVVYRSQQVGPAPVALVFHSGAFDYALDPRAEPGSPLEGVTWRGESRLTRDWADRMVWETLGMLPGTVEQAEVHLGALPAALADAGVVQLLPGNCWGDLWHSEAGFQDNDYAYEIISRNGRTFAWWMLRLLQEEGFAATQGVELPFEWDGTLLLVGLGDGGRAVVELATHPGVPPIAGALLDSTPDTLSAYLDPTLELDDEVQGLQRLWPDPLDQAEIDDWSLLALLQAQGQAPAAFPGGGDTGGWGGRDTGGWGGRDTGGADGGGADGGGTDGGGTDGGGTDGGGADGGGTDGGGTDGGGTDGGGGVGATDTGTPDAGGIEDLASYAPPARIALVWSQADPRQPRAATEATAAVLASRTQDWVIDTQARGHVFTNAAPAAATALVDFLLTGARGELDWTVPTEPAADRAAATRADGREP